MLSPLNLIAFTAFATALTTRAMEPVLPFVAADMKVSITTVAGLSAGVALAFALVQPVLGAAADVIGKAKLMLICLVIVGVASVAGAVTTSFELLFVSRIICGMAAGGVFPVAMGMAGDLFAFEQRQVALGRVLAGAMSGNILGALASGIIADFIGWRGALVVLGCIALIAAGAVTRGFRKADVIGKTKKIDFAHLRRGYRTIFANPNTPVCFTAVFIEGMCIFGLFAFIAAFLFDLGETRASIPGLVIAAFAGGGLLYTATVSRLLPRFGTKGLMIDGAALLAVQLLVLALNPSWQIHTLSLFLMGFGLYLLHGSVQVYSSDLAPEARASAMSLHAFCFFMGQAVGPIFYGFGIHHFGKTATLCISAAIILTLGIVAANLLNKRPVATI